MVLCSFFLSSKGFGQTSTNGGIYVTADLVAARGDISGLWTWSEANIICNELVDNDFSDWRLPSKEELNFLYGLHSHGSGNFKGMAYWSSTDVSSGYKATQFFHNGNASSGSLGGKYSVRCVRNVMDASGPEKAPTANENDMYQDMSNITIRSILGGGTELQKGHSSETVQRFKLQIGYTKDNTIYFTEDFSDFIINYKKLNNVCRPGYENGNIDKELICSIEFYGNLCRVYGRTPTSLDPSRPLNRGGYIVYEKDGHGLIAAPKDLSGMLNYEEAKKACEDLVLNGFSDWRLPTKKELNQLYQNKDIVGGFDNIYYWSATEYDGYTWNQNFRSGLQNSSGHGYGKDLDCRVRAVRSF